MKFTILDVPPKSIVTFRDGKSSSIGDLRKQYGRRQLLRLQGKVDSD